MGSTPGESPRFGSFRRRFLTGRIETLGFWPKRLAAVGNTRLEGVVTERMSACLTGSEPGQEADDLRVVGFEMITGTSYGRSGVASRSIRIALWCGLLICLSAGGCLYGMFAYRNHLFPYDAALAAKTLLFGKFSEPDVPPQDVESLISIHTVDEAVALRQALCNYLWGSPDPPHSLMPAKVAPLSDDRFANVRPALERLDDVTFVMEYGIDSHVYHFVPKKPNGRLVLFHAGHSTDLLPQLQQIKQLVDRGYTVAGFCMPLMGPNNRPCVTVPRVGQIQLTKHDHLKFLAPAAGHPVKYFFEPVVGFLNYAEQFHYSQISMIGLSGGGWTTLMMAAIDPRIQISCPVAGAYPIYLRVAEDELGDWEQTITTLYRTTTYLETFILGAVGPGRVQCQVFNRYDSDCYAGDGWRTYADHVKQHVDAMNSGKWCLFVDDTHYRHMISEAALQRFIDLLEHTPAPPSELTSPDQQQAAISSN